MLVPFERNVDEPEFRRLLLMHFPELSSEIEDDSGLVHCEMSALERFANKSIKSGDMATLKRTYEFVGDMGRHISEVHPDVVNAIHVSFLEGLHFANKNHGDQAKRLLPAVLLKMWNVQMEHNRKIGLVE